MLTRGPKQLRESYDYCDGRHPGINVLRNTGDLVATDAIRFMFAIAMNHHYPD